MKRFITLFLAAGMAFSATSGASAAEVKISGMWLTSFTFADNLFGKDSLEENSGDGAFNAAQRLRLNLDIIAGENLSARVEFQVANGDAMPHYYSWGTGGVGDTGKTVTARLAYLDWQVPSTDMRVRMGRQIVNFPSYTFVSPLFSDSGTVDGLLVNAPVGGMADVTFGWLRPSANLNKWGTEHFAHSSVDLAMLALNVAGEGFKISPYGMIGLHGNGVASYDKDKKPVYVSALDMMGSGYGKSKTMADIDSRTLVYWLGVGGELCLFDPFRFTADFLYSGNDADGEAGREGWYAALGAEIKAGFVTPFLRGWYASGDDADSKKSGRMLNVGSGGNFDASAIYYYANALLAPTIGKKSPAGTWGVQAGVKDVSFVDALTHRVSLTYFQGTNNTNRVGSSNVTASPVGYMTTADSAWEIDFLSSYKLYKELTANLLLAYLITDFDENLPNRKKYDNGFRGTLNFNYRF